MSINDRRTTGVSAAPSGLRAGEWEGEDVARRPRTGRPGAHVAWHAARAPRQDVGGLSKLLPLGVVGVAITMRHRRMTQSA